VEEVSRHRLRKTAFDQRAFGDAKITSASVIEMLSLPVAWVHRPIFTHPIITELELELPTARVASIGIDAARIIQGTALDGHVGRVLKEDTALRRTTGIFESEIMEEIEHWVNYDASAMLAVIAKS
jgi:hypothetical protein